ncbi:MAG: DNA polymerase III subunit [Verrucomicrobiae bacterium]|nr:DNA polymerase III subunit [Verrucomicrobiae bacterium]MDW8308841.1 DNA polymerase III subunit [Verrucomicrobiales bacterium]
MAFKDFPQHEQGVALLQRSLERERLAHAWLFTGEGMEELEALARTLAKTLLCERPRRGRTGVATDCCDTCPTCHRVAEGAHPDVRWVRPESKTRYIAIAQVRELMREVQLKPAEGRSKVAVMVEADRMTLEAANAFLKTLEEPPPRSVLILLSSEPQRLPETIVSRCLRLNFGGEAFRPSPDAPLDWLERFGRLAAEGRSLLNRYQLLGVLLKRLAEIRADVEKTLAARSPLNRYQEVDPEVIERWEKELKAAVEAEYRRRRDGVLATLGWWLRDIWLRTLKGDQARLAFPGLAATDTLAERVTTQTALENLAMLAETQRLLHTNVQEALALEVGLLKLQF